MKDWNNLQADQNLLMNKHYTAGRGGRSINKIVLHHNAGRLSIQECWNVWQTRQASAHYQVDVNGRIGQLVWDRDTAWHAGNWEANCTSIGIEHANNHVGNPWTISDATLENGAHLVAALCRYYKLGRPAWGKNVFGHKHFAATGCPGEIAGTQNTRYMARAQYWYDHMTSSKAPTPEAKSVSKPVTTSGKSVDELAREVIRGDWGNGNDRYQRLTAAGYDYDTVQARVNQLLGQKPKPAGKSIDTLAREVIRGDWGNGQERYNRLTAAGYNYNTVQARVNQILS